MSHHIKKHQAPDVGKITEQYAKQFLLNKGLAFVAENVRYKFGEIDLVMQEQTHIIFVEVRYRRSSIYGGAAGSITHVKRKRLIKAASAWLQKFDTNQQLKCRFDLIALSGELNKISCQWLKNIFQ